MLIEIDSLTYNKKSENGRERKDNGSETGKEEGFREKQEEEAHIEERRAINAAKPARNKYVEAARKFQGSFIIYDPAFM